ncbi:MAG: hypothetical protein WC260_04145 [Candidatus Pacearchaeota archaeon]
MERERHKIPPNSTNPKKPSRMLTPQQERLLDFFEEELRYGEAAVVVKKGQPVFVRIAYKDVKLD